MQKWTINRLNSMSDLRFAQAILRERHSQLKQPYSPLATKLRNAMSKLEELAAKEDEEIQAAALKAKKYTSFEEVFDYLGWSCTDCGDGTLMIAQVSPAGEDFFIYVDGKDIPKEVAKQAEIFDADEHAELWVSGRGKNGVPDTIQELLEDAEEIQKMLNELAEALATVEV